MSPADFDAARHAELAQALADALAAQPAEAVSRAAGTITVSVYPPGTTAPLHVRFPPRRPLLQAFDSPSALVAAIRERAPDAFEGGLEVLAELDGEKAAELGAQVIAAGSWPEAKDRAALSLSKSASEGSFTALLDLVGQVGRAGFLLSQSPFAGGAEVILRRLEASPILKYEPVKIPSRAEWDAMDEAGRAAHKAASDKASAAFSFAEIDLVRSLIEYLAAKRWAPAQPLLARLYVEHPSDKVRYAAGSALSLLGDAKSLELLISLGDSHDPARRDFGVEATIARDPTAAMEAVGGDVLTTPQGRDRAQQALLILEADLNAKDKSGGSPWVLADERWRAVAEKWRKDREFGAAADVLLRRLPPAPKKAAPAKKTAAAASDKEVKGEKPKATKGAKASASKGSSGIGALALLRSGDGAGAWNKLQALGDRVREPGNIDEAREVAALTMKAARASLEKIVKRLKETGYRFAWPDGVLVSPPKDIEAKLDELEAEVGALPLSLRAALTHIGEFNLAGDHPSWPKSANVKLRSVRDESEVWFTDPLALGSVERMLDDAIEGGVRDAVTLSGDDYTKAAYSGGIYQLGTPCPAADALIVGHTKGLTFVEHLRIGLQNGGFAGFAGLADAPRDYIAALVKGCAIL